jgi:hypothetical protein
MSSPSDTWVREVQAEIADFARLHKMTFRVSKRELSASFEIGCLHAVLRLYATNFEIRPENLQHGQFRYLTTPSGNPANFSYVELVHRSTREAFHVRQQVRIRSSLNNDIAFTPDIVVIPAVTDIGGELDEAYANGKRRFFSVSRESVIAAHECKSMNPFPELLVSFLGMLISAHSWLKYPECRDLLCEDGVHLAPTLFVGGTPSMWHNRMVSAISAAYPVNVVAGLHAGTWDLAHRGVNMFNLAAA